MSVQKALSVELAIELERETFGQYVSRIAVVSVLVVCFFVYPTVCQAVLNTFACYKIDSGGGLYGANQLVCPLVSCPLLQLPPCACAEPSESHAAPLVVLGS